MAKVTIAGVRSGGEGYTVHVVLTEQQEVEGQKVDAPIGEAFISFPVETSKADIKKKVIAAAQEIGTAHKDAQAKRKDIEALEFPEVTL